MPNNIKNFKDRILFFDKIFFFGSTELIFINCFNFFRNYWIIMWLFLILCDMMGMIEFYLFLFSF